MKKKLRKEINHFPKKRRRNLKKNKNCAEVKTEVKQMHGNSNGGCLIVKCGLKNYS